MESLPENNSGKIIQAANYDIQVAANYDHDDKICLVLFFNEIDLPVFTCSNLQKYIELHHYEDEDDDYSIIATTLCLEVSGVFSNDTQYSPQFSHFARATVVVDFEEGGEYYFGVIKKFGLARSYLDLAFIIYYANEAIVPSGACVERVARAIEAVTKNDNERMNLIIQ